ncbi:hypothetical protein MUK42_18956 [Musa troglodytarum]|uniref:Uncharacterized protein n=1 Tax=Musa troglodytarum TaxID=320322 RepID=A0A9E7G2X2_9LILI|nr:hypothetical protein MUK42_18956 [Musa troglodytarum]
MRKGLLGRWSQEEVGFGCTLCVHALVYMQEDQHRQWNGLEYDAMEVALNLKFLLGLLIPWQLFQVKKVRVPHCHGCARTEVSPPLAGKVKA